MVVERLRIVLCASHVRIGDYWLAEPLNIEQVL